MLQLMVIELYKVHKQCPSDEMSVSCNYVMRLTVIWYYEMKQVWQTVIQDYVMLGLTAAAEQGDWTEGPREER